MGLPIQIRLCSAPRHWPWPASAIVKIAYINALSNCPFSAKRIKNNEQVWIIRSCASACLLPLTRTSRPNLSKVIWWQLLYYLHCYTVVMSCGSASAPTGLSGRDLWCHTHHKAHATKEQWKRRSHKGTIYSLAYCCSWTRMVPVSNNSQGFVPLSKVCG